MSVTSRAGLRMASFFAGVGGFDLGFGRAGIETVWQCEKKAFCLDILEQHWPDVVRASDITEVDADDIPDAEIWAGGFPCQDVSLARMGPRSGLRGKQSGLFYDFAELIEERRPPLIVLENVAALLSSHDGRDFAVIVRTLADIGYGVAWRVLDSRHFGIPQSRQESSLSDLLEERPVPDRYFLSPNAAIGILRRADQMGRNLFPPFRLALETLSRASSRS